MQMQLKLLVFIAVHQKMKSYSELIRYSTFEERLEYLKLYGQVGVDTFGHDRYLNQALYHSYDWKKIRNAVIIRDNSCDLAIPGYEIIDHGIIHHINPITIEDVLERRPKVFDLDNLILVSHNTHNIIHYGFENKNPMHVVIERTKNDTIPWR